MGSPPETMGLDTKILVVLLYCVLTVLIGVSALPFKSDSDDSGHDLTKRKSFDSMSGYTFGKRNFDETDRARFSAFAKRNFDELDRAGFGAFHKRNFDELDNYGFGSFNRYFK